MGVFALALAGDAHAQNFQSALTGVSPANIQFKQIDLSGAVAGTPALPSAGGSGFSLTNFFRQVVGLGPTLSGSSTIPAPRYSNAYNPLPPINSTVGR
jgi:hypothetical protein